MLAFETRRPLHSAGLSLKSPAGSGQAQGRFRAVLFWNLPASQQIKRKLPGMTRVESAIRIVEEGIYGGRH